MGGQRRSRSVLIGAAALAALLAPVGCSSSEPGPAASSTTSEAPQTAPPATQDVAGDEAAAQAALLTVDELPGGPWTEGDSRDHESSPELDCPALAEESAFFNEHARGAPGAKAPELTDQSNGANLQLDVYVVADQADADRVAAFFADPKFVTCLEARFEAQTAASGSGLTLADISIDPIDLPAAGDSSAAWSISFTASNGSQSADVAGVLAFVQVGRGFVQVSLIGQTAPVTADDVDPIVQAAAAKLATELPS